MPRTTYAERFAARMERYEQQRIQRLFDHLAELDSLGPEEGLCYFLGTGDGKLVKIGYSKTVGRRVSRLRSTSGPVQLTLLATCRGGQSRERFYHHLYRPYRWQGEWFYTAPEVVAEIARLKAEAEV